MEKKKLDKNKYKFIFNFDKKKFNFYSKYINILNRRGNKAKMELGFFSILRNLKKEKKTYILSDYLTKAINTARPVLTFISKKRGGRIYRVPISIFMKREIFQSIQWTIKESGGLRKGTYKKTLLKELLNLSVRMGNAIKAKNKLHKFAEKNRMYITKYYLK